jgi:serine/threonine protein kinase
MAKLCDFGWAIHAGTGLRQTFCGTPLYVSPELLRGEQYDSSVDAWAVGILAY